jgi:hypothetical protein
MIVDSKLFMSDLHDSLKTEFGDKLNTLAEKQDEKVNRQEFDSMFNELKHMIKDKESKKDNTHAEEFIEHMTTCDDKGCSINMMGDDLQKKGFLKGFELGKKFKEKQ